MAPPLLNELSSDGFVDEVIVVNDVCDGFDDDVKFKDVCVGVGSNLKKAPSSPRSSDFVLGRRVCRKPSRKCILATTLLLAPDPERSRSEADSFRSIEFGMNFGFESRPIFPGWSLTTGELGSDMVLEARSLGSGPNSCGLLRGRDGAGVFKLEVATSTTSHK